MSRVRVQIDLNAFDADGLTRTRLSNASGDIEDGRMVVAYEPEDQSMFLALVDHVDTEKGYAFLRVNWDSMADDVTETSLATAFDAPVWQPAQQMPAISWSELVKQVTLPIPAPSGLRFARVATA